MTVAVKTPNLNVPDQVPPDLTFARAKEDHVGCIESLRERLVFTSPEKDHASEDASTQGCNI